MNVFTLLKYFQSANEFEYLEYFYTQKEIMKTKDGIEFVKGMTLIRNTGEEIKTNDETVIEDHRGRFHRIKVEGTHYEILISNLYATHEARAKDMAKSGIEKLEFIKGLAEREIDFLKGGGDPIYCLLLSPEISAVL